jgi:hypothetical protein
MDRLVLWLFACGMIVWGFTWLAAFASWLEWRQSRRDVERLLRRNRDA